MLKRRTFIFRHLMLFLNEVIIFRMLFSSLKRRSRASLSPDLVKHGADALQQQKTTLGAKNWKNIFLSDESLSAPTFGCLGENLV